MVVVPAGPACTLPGLWHCFGCAPIKSVVEGTEPREIMCAKCTLLAIFVQFVVGGDLESLSKTPDRGLEGGRPQESAGVKGMVPAKSALVCGRGPATAWD